MGRIYAAGVVSIGLCTAGLEGVVGAKSRRAAGKVLGRRNGEGHLSMPTCRLQMRV